MIHTYTPKTTQSDECIICGAPLEYLERPEEMECAICHRRFTNNVRCANGHYVCDECHTSGIDGIVGICMAETSANPVEILERLMSLPMCHMYGPEHHIMVGSALITAYHNALSTYLNSESTASNESPCIVHRQPLPQPDGRRLAQEARPGLDSLLGGNQSCRRGASPRKACHEGSRYKH